MGKKKVKCVIIEIPVEDYEWFIDKFDIVFDPTEYKLKDLEGYINNEEGYINEQKEKE